MAQPPVDPNPTTPGDSYLAAVLVLASACGGLGVDEGASSSGPSGSAAATGDGDAGAPSGTSPVGTGTEGDGAGRGGSGGDGGAPTRWSDQPAVAPIGQTIDGSMVTPDGRTRTWHLYIPTTLAADEPVPLLVGLHGGTGSGPQFQRSSGFDGIAEANGFLAVFPDGVGVGPNDTLRTWNGGGCCGRAMKDDVDDVGFVSLLIDQITSEYDVDPARIYAAGHSNGAVLSIRLACELADQIVAVGFQAGSMEIDSCTPAVPISMLHIHGEADDNVPIEGGVGSGVSATDWNPVIDGLLRLADAQDCPDPTTVTAADDPGPRIQVWSPCDEGTTIEYVVVPGADHEWMGADRGRGSEPPFAGFDSSAAIWTFLASHPRR